MKHQLGDLAQMQALPLETKVKMTQRRILEWYEHFDGNVHLSFSGGKDSTVLKHIIENTPSVHDVPAVFADTGLEFPEIRKFVKSFGDVIIVRPKMNFRQVIEKYGYPVVSKDVATRVFSARNAVADGREQSSLSWKKLNGLYLDNNGNRSIYNIEKWNFLIDAPFKISAQCCDVMKKRPTKQYQKETKRAPMLATMACESDLRAKSWQKLGCNAFESDTKNPRSTPMAFWTEQDVLAYIHTRGIPYAKTIYGDIVTDKGGKYSTTGATRTGCMFCMFGCHLEKCPNRFQKLAETHPKIYNYCINGGEEVNGMWQPNDKGLGLGRVLDYIGVDYMPIGKQLYFDWSGNDEIV